ncbi:hypothetical protein [Lactococcus sp.]|uniref:hypothetical protein n=1 Tax=Lactococcus sp. TaxID=44273 RepID=UPI002FC6C4E2
MEKTDKDLIYCQKVLQLLEDLAKVEQNIELFSEHSSKQRIRLHQGQILVLKLVFFIIIIVVGVFLELSLLLLMFISLIYFIVFCLLFRYDSIKFKEKIIVNQEELKYKKSFNSKFEKLLGEKEKIQKELNHFERIPAEFKTIETVSHMIRYMKRGEAQTLEEALYFWKMDENNHLTNK